MTTHPADGAQSVPLFSPHIEAKAMEALNVLIVIHGVDGNPIELRQLLQLQTAITRLVDCLFPMKGDRAEFSGADLAEGNDYVHPIKVAALAAVIGRHMGMPRSSLITLAMAAALMNVGYLTLRRSLLDEPRRLLDGEWEQHVHTHPDQGVALLASSGLADDCLQAIAQHHERWDGSGYPGRVRGEAIGRAARILAVADSYVSLRSLRPYRAAVDADDALREISSDSGRLFDPQVVVAFREVIERYSSVPRAERESGAGVPASEATSDERPEAQRDGIDRHGEEADEALGEAGDDAESEPSHTGSRRSAAPTAERTEADSHAARIGTGASAPPGNAALSSTAGTGTADGVVVEMDAPMPPGPPRRRRSRHGRRERETLFSARFYVAGALRGGWGAD